VIKVPIVMALINNCRIRCQLLCYGW